MVSRIDMGKDVFLGYGIPDNDECAELVGRAFGYDIYVETETSTYMTVWVYDRAMAIVKPDGIKIYRIVSMIELEKERGAWHVDLLKVDSSYKGKNLAVKIYGFILKKMDITLMAGCAQSAGGRYVWNKMVKKSNITVYAKKSPYSKVFDFPKSGNRELVSNLFDLYDSDAEIFAVAG